MSGPSLKHLQPHPTRWTVSFPKCYTKTCSLPFRTRWWISASRSTDGTSSRSTQSSTSRSRAVSSCSRCFNRRTRPRLCERFIFPVPLERMMNPLASPNRIPGLDLLSGHVSRLRESLLSGVSSLASSITVLTTSDHLDGFAALLNALASMEVFLLWAGQSLEACPCRRRLSILLWELKNQCASCPAHASSELARSCLRITAKPSTELDLAGSARLFAAVLNLHAVGISAKDGSESKIELFLAEWLALASALLNRGMTPSFDLPWNRWLTRSSGQTARSAHCPHPYWLSAGSSLLSIAPRCWSLCRKLFRCRREVPDHLSPRHKLYTFSSKTEARVSASPPCRR